MNMVPIALSMGCPAGIGPEIILKLFTRRKITATPVVVIGDLKVLATMAAQLGMTIPVCPWLPGDKPAPGIVPVYQVANFDVAKLRFGQPTLQTGKVMAAYIKESVSLIGKGVFSALVTCPISKKSLHQAGYFYPGHTEMLAELTGSTRFRMMMAGSKLKVVLVTIHEPLNRVSSLLNQGEIVDCIDMTVQSLKRDFGIPRPRIGVAGLNPHGGEGALFGDEEEQVIRPAVTQCSRYGEVSGPWPPDTVFYQAASGAFDVVIAMYHDQGLIPFKLLHFADGVNVTLGLPLVRTSVDHGTAYDIAGQGQADPSSLVAALSLAEEIVANRKGETEQ